MYITYHRYKLLIHNKTLQIFLEHEMRKRCVIINNILHYCIDYQLLIILLIIDLQPTKTRAKLDSSTMFAISNLKQIIFYHLRVSPVKFEIVN